MKYDSKFRTMVSGRLIRDIIQMESVKCDVAMWRIFFSLPAPPPLNYIIIKDICAIIMICRIERLLNDTFRRLPPPLND
jgi:hypothetical protein